MDFFQNAREMDLKEIDKMQGYSWRKLTVQDFHNSDVIVNEHDEVYGIGGVVDGAVWLLCTYRVEQHPIVFLRFIKAYLHSLLQKHETLHNYAWVYNKLHINWLHWMGAKFGNVFLSDNTNEPFVYFEFKKEKGE